MSLVDFARRELEAFGAFNAEEDFYGGMTGKAVMELIETFAGQGHSGMSASIVRGLFSKLADYQPLAPLTGADDEWQDVDGKGLFQNRRCGRVFKDNQGAYDIEGRIFREPSGACFTNKDSRVPVTFPYTPHIEYVDVESSDAEQDNETPR